MELLKKLGPRKSPTAKNPVYWGLFFCPACGENVERNLWHGRHNPSCGCAINVTHGHAGYKSRHPVYVLWCLVKARCKNPKYEFYHRYGGRGISVCSDWQESYVSFFEWAMSNGWQRGLQIDRIDNDGDYTPENCRFITGAMNVRNSSSAKLNLETVKEIRSIFISRKVTYVELGKIYGVTPEAIGRIIRFETWAY